MTLILINLTLCLALLIHGIRKQDAIWAGVAGIGVGIWIVKLIPYVKL